MYAGKVQALPYEMGESTGCDYCPYHDICGFDLRISGCAYQRLEKLDIEEAVAAMAAAVQEKKDTGMEVSGNEREMDRRAAESD